MLIPSGLRSGALRRHPERRVSCGLERLESRALLSPAAVIQWSMADRVTPDPAHGNVPDLPNTPQYVNPAGFTVLLDASHSIGILPTTTFAWTVTDLGGQATTLAGEDPSISLPQGPYTVKLAATGLQGTDQALYATQDVQVKDVLVVAIGDSYASGEGNPVVPGFFSPQWAYSPDPAINLENADAHRSTIAGPAQFALELEQSNPHQSVTFVSVANSGASIPVGVLGPMQSIGDSSYQLPAEIDELKSIIGTRHIDVLTVTVGADDIGFSTLAEDLIENSHFGTPSQASILQQFNTSLAALPDHFKALAQAITTLDPGQVMITGYPDLTRNQNGKVAAFPWIPFIPLVSKSNAQLASSRIIPPLDAVIATAAKTYKWTLVQGISADFRTHGYPSTSSWIRSLGQSIEMQGNYSGTFHPNAAGHQDIAIHFLATYLSGLGRGKRLLARPKHIAQRAFG
jgi:hypothetical protein